MNTLMAAEFLLRWPDLDALQKAPVTTRRAFFYRHHSRSAKKIEERLAAIAQAQALTTDSALIRPARHLILALAGMLRPLHQAVARLEQAIERDPRFALAHEALRELVRDRVDRAVCRRDEAGGGEEGVADGFDLFHHPHEADGV